MLLLTCNARLLPVLLVCSVMQCVTLEWMKPNCVGIAKGCIHSSIMYCTVEQSSVKCMWGQNDPGPVPASTCHSCMTCDYCFPVDQFPPE